MPTRTYAPSDDRRGDVIKFHGVAEVAGPQPIRSLTAVESIAAARLYRQIAVSIDELEAAIALTDAGALRVAAARSFSAGDLDTLPEVAAQTASAVGEHLDDAAPRRIADAVAAASDSSTSGAAVACAMCAIAGAAVGVASMMALPALARLLGW